MRGRTHKRKHSQARRKAALRLEPKWAVDSLAAGALLALPAASREDSIVYSASSLSVTASVLSAGGTVSGEPASYDHQGFEVLNFALDGGPADFSLLAHAQTALVTNGGGSLYASVGGAGAGAAVAASNPNSHTPATIFTSGEAIGPGTVFECYASAIKSPVHRAQQRVYRRRGDRERRHVHYCELDLDMDDVEQQHAGVCRTGLHTRQQHLLWLGAGRGIARRK